MGINYELLNQLKVASRSPFLTFVEENELHEVLENFNYALEQGVDHAIHFGAYLETLIGNRPLSDAHAELEIIVDQLEDAVDYARTLRDALAEAPDERPSFEVAYDCKISDGMIYVSTLGRTKVSQIGDTPADILAKLLVAEIVREVTNSAH